MKDWRQRLDARIDRCPGCDQWRWDQRCSECDQEQPQVDLKEVA